MGRFTSTLCLNSSNKKMNFLALEMTFLRYFLPLIICGNKRNVKSTVLIQQNNKYNCPVRNAKHLKYLSDKYSFDVRYASEANKDITFLVEGVGANLTNAKKISMTYMTDYTLSWKKYWNDIDYCIFPSKWFAEFIEKEEDEKSLFLGSPKYDLNLNRQELFKKYKLNAQLKYAFLPLPRARDLNLVNLPFVYDFLRSNDYKIITKSRGKDNYKGDGDFNFSDTSWFPHDSMELMSMSDLIINFDSTCIKECVMARKKVINFNVKPFKQLLPELYNEKYAANIKSEFWNKDSLNKHYERISTSNTLSFDPIIEKYLFKTGSSARILDYFGIK